MENRKKGAQPRNQNARKHGFYSAILNDPEQALLQHAADLQGLDEEIAVLRVKLREVIIKHPENVQLAFEGASTLARLVRTRYSITKEQKKSLRDAITKVMTEIAIPL